MEARRRDEERDAGHRARRDHRQDPQRGERDVDERLEELPPESLRQEARGPSFSSCSHDATLPSRW